VGILKLVFVYLGENLPKYVESNVRLVQERFPTYETVVLVDSSRLLEKYLKRDLPLYLVDNPALTWKSVKNRISYSEDFRDDFWFKTVARFAALRSYMKSNPNESILHIEADVLLSPSFPVDFFSQAVDISVAYPLTNSDQGVASTLYFRNLQSLENFLTYCEKAFEDNPEETDVSILGSYYLKTEHCWIMPTAPSIHFDFNEHASEDTRLAMSENFNQVNGVFDASTWGQFFTGHDPKNSVGITPIFVNQKHHAICTENTKFIITPSGRIFAYTANEKFELFSLHVHSKNANILNYRYSTAYLAKLAAAQVGKPMYKLNLFIFIKLLPNFLVYRIRLLARKYIKNVR
jgi:hypothetical protein